jgi:hypothetical protein
LTGNATIVTMLWWGTASSLSSSGCHTEPDAAQSDHAGRRLRRNSGRRNRRRGSRFTHATVGSLFPALPQAIRDLNVGIIALAANIVAMVVVSSMTRPRDPGRRRLKAGQRSALQSGLCGET